MSGGGTFTSVFGRVCTLRIPGYLPGYDPKQSDLSPGYQTSILEVYPTVDHVCKNKVVGVPLPALFWEGKKLSMGCGSQLFFGGKVS